MYDTARTAPTVPVPQAATDSPVPLAQIAESRRDFPGAVLGFEVMVQAPDILAGVQRCAAAIAASGLHLRQLRAHGEGRIFCRLEDAAGADVARLARDLGRPPARIESWTTVIGPGRNAR